MKTILVVYTEVKCSKKATQTMNRYAFNTKSSIKVGMLLEGDDYTTPMQVVDMYPVAYKYVDLISGELSIRKKASTKQVEIRQMHLTRPAEANLIEVHEID